MLEPSAPNWVPLTVPVVAAIATGLVTWATTKLDLLSVGSLNRYKGLWYAYYRDPDSKKVEWETWDFSGTGRVVVSRNGYTTFKGRLSLKGIKAYMHVESTSARDERLFVMLDTPNNPRNGDGRPSVCLWVGQDGDHKTTAGHALLSRQPLASPNIKEEFIRAVSPSDQNLA